MTNDQKNSFNKTTRLLVLLAFIATPTFLHAANILMNAGDTSGQSSFNAGTHWTGGAAPVAGNTYDTTAAFLLRSPSGGTTPVTFAGDKLTLTGPGTTAAGGGRLDWTGASTAGSTTINNLVVTNLAMLQHGGTGGQTWVLAGAMTIQSDPIQNMTNGCIFLTGNGPIYVSASISGSGAIDLGTPSAGNANAVYIAGDLSGFSGKILTTDAHVLIPLIISNATDQIISGPVSIVSAFSKQGSGKLTLSGSNTFTAGFTLSGGSTGTQVNLNSTNALGLSSSLFTLSGGNTCLIDNTSGGALTNMANNAQAWNSDFTFVGSNPLNLGSGNVTLGATRTVTTSASKLTVGGVISGTQLGIIKNGGGNLTLTGASTYSGDTTISAGTLALGPTAALANSTNILVSGGTFDVSAVTGGYIVNSNRNLGGTGFINGNVFDTNSSIILPGGSGTIGNLTFTNNLTLAGGDTIKFDFNSTTNDVILVNGTLTTAGSGTTAINLATLPVGGLPNGTYVLFQLANSLSGSMANFALTGAPSPSRQSFVLSYASTPKQILLTVSGTPANLTWKPVGNNAWDVVNHTNWLNGAINDYYFDGDSVSFTTIGSGTQPVLNAIVTPASVTVDSPASYTLSGTGKITGGAGLTKTNSGTLTILTPTNDYTGATYIGGGIINVTNLANGGSPSAIGASSSASANLVLDGGDLQYAGPAASINRGATLNAGGGIIEVTAAGSSLGLGGVIFGTSGGGLTKAGSGTLTFSGANNYNGATTINAGALQVSGSGALGAGNVTNSSALLFSGNFTISNNISGSGSLTNDAAGTLTLAGTNTYTGSTTINGPNFGGLVVASSGALSNTPLVTVISTTGGAGGGTRVTLNAGVSTPVGTTLALPTAGTTVRSALASAGASSWNGPITLNGDGAAAPSDQVAFLGNAGGLTINGSVTGVSFPGTLQLRGGNGAINGALNIGSATLQINDGVLWAINSSGNTWGLSQIANGTLQVGQNNALPTGTTVNFGAAGNGTLDLNGFNQAVAAIVVAGGANVITNSSATADARLTYNGAGASTFNGVIADGAHKLALTVTGGSLGLSGVNTYTGNTTISNGVLSLSGSGSIAGSPNISIGSGATFDVSGLTAGFTLGSSQTLIGAGAVGIINSNLNLGAGSLALNYTNGVPTLIETNGLLTFSNNTVTITVAGTTLPVGSYKLVAAGTGGAVTGAVVSSALTVNGAGVQAGHAASLTIISGELYLVVTNHAPIATTLSIARNAGFSYKLALSALATNWSDADGDTISFVSVGSSTNGAAVVTNGGYILYPNAANVNDQFSYVITDSAGATATGLVNLVVSTNSTGQINSFTVTGGTASMTFAGIPGYSYGVQRSTDLLTWTTILTTNAPANGLIQFTDGSAPMPTAYYRMSWQP